MFEFLIILAFLWILIAAFQDLKRREVENWLSFSLIIFSLSYVIFYSIYYQDFSYFLASLLGLAIFIGLGFLFYYARVFAGGDAKLIMGLGIFLSLSSLSSNLLSYASFLFLLLLSGAVYGLFYSIFVALQNYSLFFLEFKKSFSSLKSQVLIFLILSILSLTIPFYLNNNLFFLYPLILILFPLLMIYGKAVEKCLIKSTHYSNVTIGDWLYQKVKINGKIIRPHWEGLTEEQVNLIKKSKKDVVIKNGIPFVPAFLIAFILFYFLRNSNWAFW